MRLVYTYSILVGIIFIVWLISMIRIYHQNYRNKS